MLQQGLDDWVAASEAMPGRKILDQHSLEIPSAAAPQFPLDILTLINIFYKFPEMERLYPKEGLHSKHRQDLSPTQ